METAPTNRTQYEVEKFERIKAGSSFWKNEFGQEISFPELLDNTALSAYKKCPHYFWRSSIQELRGRGLGNIHLHAGGAFAAALEAARLAFYERGLSSFDAEEAGLQRLNEVYGNVDLVPARSGDKSLDGMQRAYTHYMLQYPLGQEEFEPIAMPNGRRGVEFTFALALPGIVHPETGNPLLYGGRFDMLAQRKGSASGGVYVLDDKTASQLGDQWVNQWELDSQPTGYIWASRSFGFNVVGAVMRGVGLLKTKTTHRESIQMRAPWMVDRWLEETLDTVEAMILDWKRGRYRRTLDKSSCGAFGGCAFIPVCASPNPENWIETGYEVVHWNPTEKVLTP